MQYGPVRVIVPVMSSGRAYPRAQQVAGCEIMMASLEPLISLQQPSLSIPTPMMTLKITLRITLGKASEETGRDLESGTMDDPKSTTCWSPTRIKKT